MFTLYRGSCGAMKLQAGISFIKLITIILSYIFMIQFPTFKEGDDWKTYWHVTDGLFHRKHREESSLRHAYYLWSVTISDPDPWVHCLCSKESPKGLNYTFARHLKEGTNYTFTV